MNPKVSIRWETPPKTSSTYADHKMWVGKCAGCAHTTQYWSWGATYGHMLEHRWIGCEGDKRRGADRKAKFDRLRGDPSTESQARLSCGGRTHSIMGDEGGSTVRRADLPSELPSRERLTALHGRLGPTTLGNKLFGRGAFHFLCLAELARINRPLPWQLGYTERGPY